MYAFALEKIVNHQLLPKVVIINLTLFSTKMKLFKEKKILCVFDITFLLNSFPLNFVHINV